MQKKTIKLCSTLVLSRVVVLNSPQDHFRWYTRSKLFSTQVYVICLFLCADIAAMVHSNSKKKIKIKKLRKQAQNKAAVPNCIGVIVFFTVKHLELKKNSWWSSRSSKLYYISTTEPLPFYYSMRQNKKYERYLQERHLCDCCELNYWLISLNNTFVERTISKL